MNAAMAQRGSDPELRGLAPRIVSAAILAPLALAAVYFGTPFFEILIGAGALVLAWEWNRLCAGRFLWLGWGFIYIAVPCWSLLYLRSDPAFGKETLFWLFAVVWAADTGAYACGRLIGGPKLASIISPNKTWAGLFGGIGAAGIVGVATAMILAKESGLALAGWSAAVGAVSHAGDLAESWVKRHFGVKDMGNILPGHGGLFDRVDGLLAAAVAVAVVSVLGEGSILTWI